MWIAACCLVADVPLTTFNVKDFSASPGVRDTSARRGGLTWVGDSVGIRYDREPGVRQLLDELCIKLGFCLPPDENRRLIESPPRDVDAFTDAVFVAEGMGDMRYTDLRRRSGHREPAVWVGCGPVSPPSGRFVTGRWIDTLGHIKYLRPVLARYSA